MRSIDVWPLRKTAGKQEDICRQITTDLGVSHRTSGIAKYGKFLVGFHSELRVTSIALGKPHAVEEQLEPQKNGETQMNESNTGENGVKNMSEENCAAGRLPWWWCIFILMAPLV